MLELLARDSERTRGMSGRDERVRHEPHEPRVVEVDLVGNAGVVPQLEGLEVVLHGLLGPAQTPRVVTGAETRRQGGGVVPRQTRVAGQLCRRTGGRAVLQGAHVGRVESSALARQEVVVDRLRQQGMAELVVVVAARHEDVALDGLAHGTVEIGRGESDDGAQRGVRHPAAGDGCGPDDRHRELVEALEPDQEHVGEVVGDASGAHPGGPDELLDEERVALGPAHDVADLLLGQRLGVELVDEAAYVGGAEGLQLDAFDPGHPGPDGDLATQGVTAVEVVGAVRRDQRDGRLEPAAEQEAHEVAGRLVGPVEVLDHEQQRLVGGRGLGERVDGLEQGALVGGDGLGVGRAAQHPLTGQQTEQGGVTVGDVVEELGQLASDAAGDLGEGKVRKGAVGEVEAMSGEHLPAVDDGPVAQLGEQPGLADPGVAGEEYGGPLGGDVSRRGDAERGAEVLQLGISTDQLRRHAVHDVVDHGQHLS